MKMDKIAGSGNDEFYTPYYAVKPILKYIKKRSVIWCPFDTEESIFVKCFKREGHTVINTHISKGEDFFSIDVPDCDYIISNPPYSLKNEVLERLFNIKKPFAMLLGVVGIFESKHRFNLFKNNDFEIMYLDKRVSYMSSYDSCKTEKNPPFQSVYITSNILEEKIVFEEINKKEITFE
ncbi:MAG: tRNA (adenine-N(6)-)-methyltransferase, partial [Bacteroides sp.]